MKLKIDRKFPLVAVSLIIVSISAFLLMYNQIVIASSALSSNERFAFTPTDTSLDLDWALEPPIIRNSDGFGIEEYVQPVPAPRSLDNPWETIDKESIKTISDESIIKSEDGFYYTALEFDGILYVVDLDREVVDGEINDYREIKKEDGRNQWLLAYFLPRIITLFSIGFLSTVFAFALLVSYFKGSLTKKNVVLVRISSFVLGAAVLSHLIARGVFQGGFTSPYFSEVFDWPNFLIGSVFPSLIILLVILGTTNIVTQHMKKSIVMKEEIDGTI